MRALSDREEAQARAAYVADASVSVDQLAAEYGVARSTMLRVLAGVTRPKGGRQRGSLSTTRMAEMRAEGLTYFEIARQAGLSESGVYRRLTRPMRNREQAG